MRRAATSDGRAALLFLRWITRIGTDYTDWCNKKLLSGTYERKIYAGVMNESKYSLNLPLFV